MQEISSEFECLQLRGASPCGAFGACTQLSGGANNDGGNGTRLLLTQGNVKETCRCQEGWFQTAEISLYFISAEELEAGLGLCNINKGLLGTMYGLMLGISLIGLLMLCIQVSRWKQVRRLAPLFAALILASFTSFYRLVRFDHALIGKDVFFTLLVANLAYLPVAATVIFTEKYLTVLTLKVLLFGANTLRTFKLFQKFNRWALIADVLVYQLFWLSLFTRDQQTIGQTIFRIALGVWGMRALSLFVIMRITLTRFISDMKKILDQIIEPSDLNAVSGSNIITTKDSLPGVRDDPNYNPAKSQIPKKFVSMKSQIRDKLVPNTKQYRLFCDFSILSIFIAFTLSASWPLLTYNFSYINPFYHIAWQVVNVTALFNNRGRKKRDTFPGDSSQPVSSTVKLVNRSKSKNLIVFELKKNESKDD